MEVTVLRRRSGAARGLPLASVTISAMLFLTACSGSVSSAAPSSAVGGGSAPAASGAQPSGSPIHFGVLRPFTGKYASVGTAAREGALTAAKAINAAGGILGRPLVVDYADTLGDPADAVPALNQLVSVDNVVGIIGPGGAEIAAVQPILDRYQIPFMFGGGNPRFDTNTDPYFWRVTPSDSQLGVAMAVYAYQKGYRKAAMLFSSIDTAQSLKAPISGAFEKLGGSIVADVSLSPGQLSYSSEVLKVWNAKPDVIFTQMEPQTGAVVVSNFKELGGLLPFVGSDITAGSDFIAAVTPAVASKYFTSLVGSSTPGPGTSAYQSYFNQLYPGQQPPAGSQYAYDATIVLALAIDAAGSTDSSKVIAAIPQVSDPPGQAVTTYKDALAGLTAKTKINYEGASGPMDFNAHNNVFGPFDAVQSDANGKLITLATVSPADLAKAAP
ncbi:MAG: ABC transporter substrate-binding protein [Candidatus Limnocylindrales bacterium]